MGYRERYDAYMVSAEWRERRHAVLKRDNQECRQCGERHGLTVHHLTYARVFRERLEDLITLCRNCHEQRHRKTDAPQSGIPRKTITTRSGRAARRHKKQRSIKTESRRNRRERRDEYQPED